jgi:hypothetical protein
VTRERIEWIAAVVLVGICVAAGLVPWLTELIGSYR